MTQDKDDFVRTDSVDTPGIVGARWWQEGLEENRAAGVGRREALKGMLLGGGALPLASAALATFGVTGCDKDEDVEFKTENRAALKVQQEFGWSFGAPAEPLTFDGQVATPFDKSALARLSTDLAPVVPAHKPYYMPTLFQAPNALPKTKVEMDSPAKPLADVLKPINTTSMQTAYKRGKAFARMFEKGPKDMALVVDLPGPDAVAFAAGAGKVFDPVFTFDNWPHPRGVVPAHLTLAAAAYYQPTFAKLAKERNKDTALMMLVLDRNRLNAYKDDATQFDNRYLAKLPPVAKLANVNVKRVIYVVPGSSDIPEMDDLNADFVEYSKKDVKVHLVAASDFRQDSDVPEKDRKELEAEDDYPPYVYGGDYEAGGGEGGFYADYPVDSDRVKGAKSPTSVSRAKSYSPSSRTTSYSSSTSGADGTTKTSTTGGFGHTSVAVAAAGGVVLGAAAAYGARARASGTSFGKSGSSRSGSFGRGFGRSGG